MKVTGSATERAIECPPSVVLPGTQRTTEASIEGTWRHRYLQRVREIEREAALLEIPLKYRSLCDAIDLDQLPPSAAGEVSFAYDIATDVGRELGRGLERNYGELAPFEIAMTVDVFALDDDTVYIGDYKGPWSDASPAGSNAQLATGALAACRAYDRSQAVVEIMRVKSDGPIYRDSAMLSAMDLEAHWGRLTKMTVEVTRAQQALANGMPLEGIHEGPWCTYCPAFNSCPAKLAIIRMMATGQIKYWAQELPQELTEQDARKVYWMLKRIKAVLQPAEAAYRAYAAVSPIDLGDGTMYGEVVGEGNEQLDGDVAWRVARELRGIDFADQWVSRSATKSGLTNAARDHKLEGETIKSVKDEILQAVRDQGGAERPIKKSLKIYPAPAKELPARGEK